MYLHCDSKFERYETPRSTTTNKSDIRYHNWPKYDLGIYAMRLTIWIERETKVL